MPQSRTLFALVLMACLLLTDLVAAPALGQCVEPDCNVLLFIDGEASGDQFGWAVENVGDLDGDGYNDLISGAPTHSFLGTNNGRAYTFSGRTGEAIHVFTGASGDQLGWSVGTVGDVNGDGVPDLIAGGVGNGPGRAVVYSGTPDGSVIYQLSGEVNGDFFGYSVNPIGDLDDDGTPDFAVSATRHDAVANNAGRAYVYSGIDGTLIAAMDPPPIAGAAFGGAVDGVGDVNGDGLEDVVVGAPGAQRAYVFSGATLLSGQCPGSECTPLLTLDPGGPAGSFGQFFIDGMGDVNADGTPDIYVTNFGANRAHIFSGVDGSILWTWTGDGSGGFGIGRGVGDVNNDGFDDMILCAWVSGIGAGSAGKAFLYSGMDGTVFQTWTHTINGATFGFDATGMEDLNDDGMTDYLVSAAWNAGQTGRVYLMGGSVVPFAGGDLDMNGSVDSADYATFHECLGGPGSLAAPPGCSWPSFRRADIDNDGDADLADYAALARNFGM